jgi:hypothetical protein
MRWTHSLAVWLLNAEHEHIVEIANAATQSVPDLSLFLKTVGMEHSQATEPSPKLRTPRKLNS